MNRSVGVVLRFVGIAAVAAVLGWAGCSGGEPGVEFDCEDHDQCLDDEACLDEMCVDAPVEGESCPEAHDREEYENLR